MKIQQSISVICLVVCLGITTPYFWWNGTFLICFPINKFVYKSSSSSLDYLINANFVKIRFREIPKNQRFAKFAKIYTREIYENFFIREIRENKLPQKKWKVQSQKLILAKICFRENFYTRKFLPLRYIKKKLCPKHLSWYMRVTKF